MFITRAATSVKSRIADLRQLISYCDTDFGPILGATNPGACDVSVPLPNLPGSYGDGLWLWETEFLSIHPRAGRTDPQLTHNVFFLRCFRWG